MAADKFPVTPAIRVLRAHGVAFQSHLYDYQPRGGTAHSASELGVDEHIVIKTLVLVDDQQKPLIALMHGDLEVSTQGARQHLGRRSIEPADPTVATKHSGYEVGGTSPFGLRKPLPVYLQASIVQLPLIYINGGKRGYLVSLAPSEVVRVLSAQPVEMAAGRPR